MSNKIPNPNQLKAKYQTLKGEVQGKLSELNNEVIKDELSHDILAKKDELIDLIIKKYSATKATAIHEVSNLRSTVTDIVKTAMNAKAMDDSELKDVAEDKSQEVATA